MRIVIEVPDDLKDTCDYDDIDEAMKHVTWFGLTLALAIRDGIVLPEQYGRLIDADAFERRCMFDADNEDMQDVIYALRDFKPIIEATGDREND